MENIVNERRRNWRFLSDWILIPLLACAAAPAAARMYQWVDPRTGSVQLAGAPPGWYRSEQRGPRVIVIERGRVIDDTAHPVDPPQRDHLRRSAFGETTAAPVPKLAQELSAEKETVPADTLKSEIAPDQPTPEADQLKEFRALLDAWDREQSAAATHTLSSPHAPSSLPPPPSP